MTPIAPACYESAMRVPFTKMHGISNDYVYVDAFATTIDEAARKATEYMIDYLVAEHGLTPEEAYILCSLAGDLKISEVVDVPHMLVSMHMPKEVLGT